jgi:hypothetical protein
VWLIAGLGACAAAPERLLDADPARDGLDGLDGPYGVARVRVRAAARVTDTVRVSLVYPADADLGPAVVDAPSLVLVHGGLVDPDRYTWLAIHAASRGWAVALPEGPAHLAIFASGDPEVALDALRDASEPGGALPGLASDVVVAAAGHSLGGVVATDWFLRDPVVDGAIALAAWASVAPPADLDRPVLALVGSRDGSAPPEDVVDGFAGWTGPLAIGVVDGMTHYAWTDDVKPGEASGEPEPSRPIPALRQDALRAVDGFLDALDGGPEPDRDLPGITWR